MPCMAQGSSSSSIPSLILIVLQTYHSTRHLYCPSPGPCKLFACLEFHNSFVSTCCPHSFLNVSLPWSSLIPSSQPATGPPGIFLKHKLDHVIPLLVNSPYYRIQSQRRAETYEVFRILPPSSSSPLFLSSPHISLQPTYPDLFNPLNNSILFLFQSLGTYCAWNFQVSGQMSLAPTVPPWCLPPGLPPGCTNLFNFFIAHSFEIFVMFKYIYSFFKSTYWWLISLYWTNKK